MTNDRRKRAQRAEQMRLERQQAAKRQRMLLTGGIVLAVIVVIALGAWAVNSSGNKVDHSNLSKVFVAPHNVGDDYNITYDTKTVTGTAASNPVKVSLYEDFQCPICNDFEKQKGDFLTQSLRSGDITIDWHPVSILDRQSKTEYASRALNAALCVLDTTDVETYARMHELLYANQPKEGSDGLSDAKLVALAKQAGAGDLTSCITTRKFGPWIIKATAVATKDGLPGTPWIKVGGKEVNGGDIETAVAAAKS